VQDRQPQAGVEYSYHEHSLLPTRLNFNTANGYNALLPNTDTNNTAFGTYAYIKRCRLFKYCYRKECTFCQSTGIFNTGYRGWCTFSQHDCKQNVAVGKISFLQSYSSNTPYDANNVAVGYQALYSNHLFLTEIKYGDWKFCFALNITGYNNTQTDMHHSISTR
jgi:hypothetical protein